MTAAPRPPRKLLSANARGLPLLDRPLLELGCGHGTHLAHCAPKSLGVDRDEGALQAVRELGCRTAQRDLDQPGWSEGLGRWPLVLAADLLVHLERPDVLLAEVARVLDDDGRLLLVEWVWPRNTLLDRLCRALVPGAAAHRRHPEHLHVFSEADVVAALQRHGLVVEDVWVHSVGSRALGRLMAPLWPPRSFLARAAGGSGPA